MKTLFILAIGVVLALAGCKGQKTKADLTTPRAAAKSFAVALEEGDVASAKASVAAANDKEGQVVEALVKMAAAIHKMSAAAKTQFGDAGKSMLNGDGVFTIADKVDAAEEKIDGDTATLTLKQDTRALFGSAPVPPTMKIKKTGDQWKIEGIGISDPAMADLFLTIVQGVEKANTDLSEQLAAGDYKTVEQAKAAQAKAMLSALMGSAAAP